jgi:spore maturation protein CgeB
VEFLKSPYLTPGPDLGGLDQNLDFEKRLNLQALITWRASRWRRLEVLSAMPQGLLQVNGDPGWLNLIPGLKPQGRLDYHHGLANHYREAAINLNITSAQMKKGFNQRVFDVPACGGFLLTDYRERLLELFEPDEVVTYQEPAEAAEKALWYLERPEQRAAIAKKAWNRTLSEHLYVHRLEKLTKIVMGYRS